MHMLYINGQKQPFTVKFNIRFILFCGFCLSQVKMLLEWEIHILKKVQHVHIIRLKEVFETSKVSHCPVDIKLPLALSQFGLILY